MILLGKQIALLRKQQNLTQAQLAFEVEISREQLVRIEKENTIQHFIRYIKFVFL